MVFALILAAALANDGGSPLLGTELRQDGFSFQPPQGFLMARKELFGNTRAGAVSEKADAPRWLSAALIDRPGEDAASLLLSVIDRPFEASPGGRDSFSAAVVRHYSDELGIKFAMERAELVGGSVPRVEVLGTVRQENQVRQVLIAAMSGDKRHVVVTFSAPSGRWAELQPAVRASLNSYRSEVPETWAVSRGVAGIAALLFAGALIVSMFLWRRRLSAERLRG
jgi:hypothetical protein